MHIDLPPEVFQGVNPSGRAHFVYFRNSKLFASSHDDVTEVISATIGKETRDLRKCIVITMINIKVRLHDEKKNYLLAKLQIWCW